MRRRDLEYKKATYICPDCGVPLNAVVKGVAKQVPNDAESNLILQWITTRILYWQCPSCESTFSNKHYIIINRID